jgi:hypothetical protein
VRRRLGLKRLVRSVRPSPRNSLARSDSPRRHTAQHAVSHDQRVKQNRSKMRDECQEQEVGENRVRSPQHRVQHDAVRKASHTKRAILGLAVTGC